MSKTTDAVIDQMNEETVRYLPLIPEKTDQQLRVEAVRMGLKLAEGQDNMIFHVVVQAADAFFKYMKDGSKIDDE